VPRFDNQSGDPSLQWMERGMAEALVMALETSARYRVVAGGAPAATNAPLILHGRFSSGAGALEVNTALEDVRTRHRVDAFSTSSPGIVEAVNAAARDLDPAVKPLSFRPDALRFYVEALESAEAPAALAALDRAIAADPNFGRAYIAAVQIAKARAGREAMERYLNAAAARGEALGERERHQLAHERALLTGNAAGQVTALENLARLNAQDPARWRALAQAEVAAGRPADAASHYRRAAGLTPDDPVVWNELGYALAMTGNVDEAVKALRTYERLRPQDGNPLDSLGDVHFHHRRFAEAGQFYLDAHERQKDFLAGAVLYKAAIAFYLHGDLARGDAAFGRFRAVQGANPGWALWQSEWEALTGRRAAAVERLSSLASRQDALGAQARGHLVMLALDAGDRAAAQRHAVNALPPAVVFFALPHAAPADWQKRVERLPDLPVRDELLGYALMFDGYFGPAAQAFEAARKRVSPLQQPVFATLEAWCLRKAGRTPDPALTRHAPIPQPTGYSPFVPVVYSRVKL
jgi:tetratricopeptide (TPR) repeat protein